MDDQLMQGFMTASLLFGASLLFSVVVPGAWGQGQAGFISIDCGSAKPYVDPVTQIQWVTDEGFITTGTSFSNVPLATTDFANYSELTTLRYFKNSYAKNCYSLPVTAKATYMLRAVFYYGSYDSAAEAPSFRMSVDATVVANITTDAVDAFYWEYTVRSQDNVIFLCLLRDESESVPFISAISLRPGLVYTYFDLFLTELRYIFTRKRLNFGGSTNIRYPDDIYDRYWEPQGVNSSHLQQRGSATSLQALATNQSISVQYSALNDNVVAPPAVLQTAVVATSGNLTVSYLSSIVDNFYTTALALYFAELDPTANLTSREFYVKVPGFYKDYYEDPFNTSSLPSAYAGSYWYFWGTDILPGDDVVLYPTKESSMGPILNALEFFEVSNPVSNKTVERDALAIATILSDMNLLDWTGDPCLPYPHPWVTCSEDAQPQIIAINLTGYNLNTNISPGFASLLELIDLSLENCSLTGPLPYFGSLTKLQILNLQNNMLSGPLPIWLASFSNLTKLFVQNNEFQGPIPPEFFDIKRLNFMYHPGNILLVYEDKSKGSKTTLIIILSISLSALTTMAIGICALFWRIHKNTMLLREIKQEFAKQQVQPILYSYSALKLATGDFQPTNKLGEGGYGTVYKGTLLDGTDVAVKRLSQCSRDVDAFLNEVVLITGIRHRNLTKLKGCCSKDIHRILVYEYVENKNLAESLWGSSSFQDGSSILDWPTRFNICIDIARGLIYLHEDSHPRIIHRDIKAPNILLDKDWNAKIADFGLVRLFPDEQSHLSTMHIAGTMGYIAPEYASRGQLTEKVDVYSYGVLLLEVIGGRKNIDYSLESNEVYLLEWAWTLYEEDKLVNLLDHKLNVTTECFEQVLRVISVALLCIQTTAHRRPSMSSILAMLLGEMDIEVVLREPTLGKLDHIRILAQTLDSSFLSSGTEESPLLSNGKTHSNKSSNVIELSDMTPR